MVTEFVFRFITSGFYGALTQRFRLVERAALGTMGALVVLPALAHSLEFVVHTLRGTPELGASMAASIAFTMLSTAFNLFAMRRGVLVIGTGANSLGDDLKAMPRLVLQFVVNGIRSCRALVPWSTAA
jgi:hypothetical protein